MAALRRLNIPPGDYVMPYGSSMAAMKDPGSTLRSMIDGLVYACLTAGAFGWLWP